MIAALGADGGAAGESFTVQFQVQPPMPLYNGTTALLSQLNQPVSFPVSYLAAVYEPNNTSVNCGGSVGTPGTLTHQLTP